VAEICQDIRTKLIASIYVDITGCITICSKPHLDWHLILGRLYCFHCGFFFKGAKGLRYHQVIKHGIDYKEAQREALDSELQMVAYSADMMTIARWKMEAKNISKAKEVHDDGLVAAKEGDLVALKRLVVEGWDVCSVDRNGCNALHWAAGGGFLDVCRFLIDTCKLDVNELRGKKGMLKSCCNLCIPSHSSNSSYLHFYISVHVILFTGMNRHCLHWAARNGHIDVMNVSKLTDFCK